MTAWLGPLAVGFLGSAHCLGMCGPLVVAYSIHLDPSPVGCSPVRRGIAHHLAFHLGRLFTYGLLGALAAFAFRGFGPAWALARTRGGVSLAAGGVMVYLGLALLRIVPMPGCAGSLWGRVAAPLLRLPGFAPRAALGAAAGFLPCCFTWAMLAQAATTWSPLRGFASMVFFGIGTVPALLLPGLFASVLTLRLRVAGERAGALGVIAMGAILLGKGARALG